MIISNLSPKKSGLNFSDIYLADANAIFPAIVGKLRPKEMQRVRTHQSNWKYAERIVSAIEDGRLKNCAISTTTKRELFGVAEKMQNSSDPFREWLEKIGESDHSLLYEFVSSGDDVRRFADKITGYKSDMADKIFLGTLIASGISKGISDDNDIYVMQRQAAKMHIEEYRRRFSGVGYTPLSIVDSKYFCQIQKLI